MKIIAFLFAIPAMAQYTPITPNTPVNVSQLNNRPVARAVSGIPTGNCTTAMDFYLDTNTGKHYVCRSSPNGWVEVPLFSSSPTANRCVRTDSQGNLTVAGFDCGSGGGGGEANTASNVGTTGVNLFDIKVGVDLRFRKLNAASNKLSVVLDGAGNKVDVDVVPANIVLSSLSGDIATSRVTNLDTSLAGKQTLHANLTSFSAFNSNGLFTQTAAGTYLGRSITALSSKINVSNGDGVGGNPGVDVNEANLNVANIGGNLPSARVVQPFSTMEIGNGVNAGFMDFFPPLELNNSAGFQAPASRSTKIRYVFPTSDAAGLLHAGTPSSTLSTMTIIGLDTDTALTSNSDIKVATQRAVKSYVDSLVGVISAGIVNPLNFAVKAMTDPFCNGADTIDHVGNLGWKIEKSASFGTNAATYALGQSTTLYPCGVRLITGGTGNDNALMFLPGKPLEVTPGTTLNWEVKAAVEVSSVAANTDWGFGFGADSTQSHLGCYPDKENCMGFNTPGGSTKFQFTACSTPASTCTTTNSTVNSATGYHEFRIFADAAGAIFFAVDNETPIAATVNIPAVAIAPGFSVYTFENASKYLIVKNFAAKFTGLQ